MISFALEGEGMSVLNTDHRSASYIHYEVGDRDSRPWGTWEVLATGHCYTVKRISVLPGHRLSRDIPPSAVPTALAPTTPEEDPV